MYPAPEPQEDSYGTLEGVAALAQSWTNDGLWLDDEEPYVKRTNPSLTTVVRWLDQVSDMLNTALASYGFVTPLVKDNSIQSATMIVEGVVADLARYVNTNSPVEEGVSIWNTIRTNLDEWVKLYAPGLEQNGETRNGSNNYEVSSRGTDRQGNKTFPIFQRSGFGNSFIDWNKPK